MNSLTARLGFACFILAPTLAQAQFEGLRFTELPPVGSWAEYQVTRRNESQRIVTSLKVAFLSRQTVGGEEYNWFQVETESDEYGPKRLPIVTQFALTRADALARTDYTRKSRELIVQVATAPAFRIPREYIDHMLKKNLLTGGEKGAGSDVSYQFRDLERETLTTRAGKFSCEHKKGLGRAEVVLDHTQPNPPRFPVDAIMEIWFDRSVPFGVIKQSVKQTGEGPKSDSVNLSIDSEEILELVAYGTGAKSAIQGPIAEYNPANFANYRPGAPAPATAPGGGAPPASGQQP